MALGSLGQVHISVTDVDRSVAFYRDVLGIPHLFTVPGQPMAFFQAGDVRLYLGVPESAEYTSRCVLYFRVDDIDAEVQRLRGHALTIEDPHVAHREGPSELWLADLTDPDGHHIILMEDRIA
jgi:predicted enzyme related to lactoylglutathione lyase